MQAAAAEGVPCARSFNGPLLQEGGFFYAQILIIGPASVPSHGKQDQRDIIFLPEPFDSLIKILFSGKPLDFIIGNLQHVTLRKAPGGLFLRLVQGLPQRGAQIGIEGNDRSALFRQTDGLLRGLPHALMGHGKGAEVKKTGASDQSAVHLIRGQQHVRAGIAVEGKIPVPVRKGLNEGQSGPCVRVHDQAGGIDTRLLQNGFQLQAEDVPSYLAGEGRGMPQFIEHGQYVAGRAAGIGLK